MKYIRRFSELGVADVPLAGGKNASLGKMVRVKSMIRQTVEGARTGGTS